MLASDIPAKTPTPWATSPDAGTIRTVPLAPPGQLGAASFQKGFPAACFVDPALGGSWPFGQDVQFILNLMNQWSRWQQAGGAVYFDGAFSTAVGGYPAGAVLNSSVSAGLLWESTADNNTTDPDGGSPLNWVAIGGSTALGGDVSGPSSSNVIGAAKVTGAKTANNTIANANLLNMPSATLKGNNTGGAGVPLDLNVTQILTMLGINISGLLTSAGNLQLGIPGVGTLIFQWGQHLATITSEGQVNVTVTTPFPNQVLFYDGTAINNAGDIFEDLMVQTIQNQGIGGANPGLLPFFLQSASLHIKCDGISWWALGF